MNKEIKRLLEKDEQEKINRDLMDEKRMGIETLKEKAERIKAETAYEEEQEQIGELIDVIMPEPKSSNHCTKCGDEVLGDENSLCGNCI